MSKPTEMQIGPDLYVRMVEIKDLKEQDVNAQVMSPTAYERLTANIKHRGAPESLPYCIQPNNEGTIEIVSGHHRVRACRAAGIETIAAIVDTLDYERGEVVAKQLAHNALVGKDDPEIKARLVDFLETADQRLLSGLSDDELGREDIDTMRLFTPRVDFDFRTVTFAFLPHQQAEMEQLIDMLDGKQDLVVAAAVPHFEELLKTAARFARLKNIRAGGTAITLMIRLATEAIEEMEAEEAEKDAAKP